MASKKAAATKKKKPVTQKLPTAAAPKVAKRQTYKPVGALTDKERKARNAQFKQLRTRSPRLTLKLLEYLKGRIPTRDWLHVGVDPTPVLEWVDDATTIVTKFQEDRPRGARVTMFEPDEIVRILPGRLDHYAGLGIDEKSELTVVKMLSQVNAQGRMEHRVKCRVEIDEEPMLVVVRATHLARTSEEETSEDDDDDIEEDEDEEEEDD